ncbi:MAG: 6,7-dimethyl-8-ribityllumazine synthase [Pseudomonadota bacterium]
MSNNPHLLVIDAPYYSEISASLMEGVTAVFESAGATHDYVAVPGVLEIPAAVAMVEASEKSYDGYVVIGCVIRGETTHYDIVANESARSLMDLVVNQKLALGNGIQTVENEAQAWARAKTTEKNKGGGAAEAALSMIKLRQEFLS